MQKYKKKAKNPTICLTLQKIFKMDYLPKEPAILVSSVNMLLRDEEFDTLESLCYNFNVEPEELKSYLQSHGYVFSEEQMQFRPIGYDESQSDDSERQHRDRLQLHAPEAPCLCTFHDGLAKR